LRPFRRGVELIEGHDAAKAPRRTVRRRRLALSLDLRCSLYERLLLSCIGLRLAHAVNGPGASSLGGCGHGASWHDGGRGGGLLEGAAFRDACNAVRRGEAIDKREDGATGVGRDGQGAEQAMLPQEVRVSLQLAQVVRLIPHGHEPRVAQDAAPVGHRLEHLERRDAQAGEHGEHVLAQPRQQQPLRLLGRGARRAVLLQQRPGPRQVLFAPLDGIEQAGACDVLPHGGSIPRGAPVWRSVLLLLSCAPPHILRRRDASQHAPACSRRSSHLLGQLRDASIKGR
jgi:hypothetical protein